MEKYQLSHECLEAVRALKTPASQEEFLRRYTARNGNSPETADGTFARLRRAKLLSPSTENGQPTDYEAVFGEWRSQRGMLADHARTSAFGRAVAAQVRDGEVVVDVGSGSGILSLFAARAGARKVYGLEATNMVHDAALIAEANGYAGVINFVHGDAAAFACDEPVDVVVGEWAGMYLIDEWRHFGAFCQVRDRFLRQGGRCIPHAATFFISPIEDSRLYYERGFGFWKRPVHGFDFSLARQRQLQAPRRIIVQADKNSMLEEYQLATFDCTVDGPEAFFVEREFSYTPASATACHGFIGYFNLDLAPGIVLETSPFAPLTCWQQSYFPIEEVFLGAQETMTVRVRTYREELFQTPKLDLTVELHRNADDAYRRAYSYAIDNSYS